MHEVIMKKIFTTLTLALALSACTNSTNVGVSNVNRSQLFLFSSDEINAEAATLYSQTLSENQSKHTLNTDKALYNRVNKVAQRLIAKAPFFREDAKDWAWEVNVINADILNAWCLPGGKIAVYSGLIKDLKLTDDELAVVIGHEIAHALREHSREQASSQALTQGAIGIAGIFGIGNIGVSLSNIASNVFISLPFSRAHETEADRIGLELCALAGFNVDAGVSVWQKMSQANSDKPIELLSTHPSDESRISDLERLSSELKLQYKK